MELDVKGKRVYVTSDIHNDASKFLRLLAEIDFSDGDILIIDGDIFDRGWEACELLKEVRKHDNILVLQGNHDAWLCNRINDVYAGKKTGRYLKYESFELLKDIYSPEEMLEIAEWITTRPLYINLTLDDGRRFQIAHAQTYDRPTMVTDPNWFYMGNNKYDEFLEGKGIPSDVISVIGHVPTPTGHIMKLANKRLIRIDCGNGYREFDDEVRLGAIRLNDMKEYYIENDKKDT